MPTAFSAVQYRLKVSLRRISPMVRRRLVVPSDLTLHGDVEEDALDIAEPDDPLEPDEVAPATPPQARKLLRHLWEFGGTIADNARMIPNHAERRR